MIELGKKEMLFRYSAIGCVLGFVLTVTDYALLLYSGDTAFSFAAVWQLHQTHPVVYLVDALALPGLVIGAFIGQWRYKQFHALSERIRQETGKNEEIRDFTHSLIAGDLSQDISLKHIERSLSDALYKLRDSLKKNREMETQRRLDERQRNWTSEGLAEFGDILRTHSMDMEGMAYSVISRLVRYLDANQGAIFFAGQDGGEPCLDMVACHAYDRKKFPDKRIAWGEGLIGAAAMEKKG